MARIKLENFERRIHVRQLTPEDYDDVCALQLRCFPGMKPWLREQYDSQMRLFPQGQLGVEYKGRLVASSSSLIVDFGRHEAWHNWKEISDNGYIRNHDPEGDTLYGIEIMVDPRYRGMKLARRLYEERKRLCREMNLQRIIIGGRIPGYGKHADQMSATEYVEKVMDKTFIDPVLTTQVSNGFVLQQLIPDYFPSDTESRGYATFCEWVNLEYRQKDKGLRHYRAVAPVRICVVQYEMRRVDTFNEFARQCEFFVETASDYQADFVLFPIAGWLMDRSMVASASDICFFAERWKRMTATARRREKATRRRRRSRTRASSAA